MIVVETARCTSASPNSAPKNRLAFSAANAAISGGNTCEEGDI
jgi:hypothetical protein